jgi:hypothetical protein
VEPLWSSVQIDLPDGSRRVTQLEPGNATFGSVEVFCDLPRCHATARREVSTVAPESSPGNQKAAHDKTRDGEGRRGRSRWQPKPGKITLISR